MATRSDFTDEEWAALQKGLTGSAMLVSLSDRDFTDTFGEVGAMAKFFASQQLAAPTEVTRELAKTKGSGFGFGTSPDKLRTETEAALRGAVATLTAKAPDELGPYRDLVTGVAETVAAAKGGVASAETQMLDAIRAALDADASGSGAG
jgi:hypothetical protein